MECLFRSIMEFHTYHKLSGYNGRFQPPEVRSFYYRHCRQFHINSYETCQAWDVLIDSHLLTIKDDGGRNREDHDAFYDFTLMVSERAIELATQSDKSNVLKYLEHHLRFKTYWGDIVPMP